MAKKAARRRSNPRPRRRASASAGRSRTDRKPSGPIAETQRLSDAEVEAALVSGEHSGLLTDYFGEAQYNELRRLAKEAAARGVRGGERVLILPGIMGSTLGIDRLIDDVLWIDPIDFVRGRLKELSLSGGNKRIEPLGVILFTYLALKLRLRMAGFDADFHPFDWRQSLVELGKGLSETIAAQPGRGKVAIVAHSMGGLVARACLAHPHGRLGRVVMLGTPNFGSFSPIQAFRGTSSMVRKVAFIDLSHDAEGLASIFATFPGLCQMLPARSKYPADFFNLASWPQAGFRPGAAILAGARRVQGDLPTDHDDIVMIAGVEQDTVVDAQVEGGEFVYSKSREGDGTVPLICAILPSARRTYYVAEAHGSLPNNGSVQAAVIDILRQGETAVLADRFDTSRSAERRTVRERDERVQPYDGSPGRALSLAERRQLIDEFAAPLRGALVDIPSATLPPLAEAAAGTDPRSEVVVIGRRQLRRLEITLVYGSLTEVDAGAYVVGLFPNVAPGGAVSAIDRQMKGAIGQMLGRRTFNANVGEVTMIPTGRHPVRADIVAFAGLGPFDGFDAHAGDILEIVGENVARTFVATRVDDVATVPIGGSSGEFNAQALRSLLAGFLRGMRDADQEQRFRSISICELDEGRFNEMRQEVYRLCGTTLFDGVEVTLREVRLPQAPAVVGRSVQARPQSVYLIVRQDNDNAAKPEISASVLTVGAKAAISRESMTLDVKALEEHLGQITEDKLTFGRLAGYGQRLAQLVLPDRIRSVLGRYPEHPLVVVHDAAGSRVPWELLHLGDGIPALNGGLSHRYEAENLSIAKWLDERQHGPTLDILLVVNPTQDLAGAEAEGDRLLALAGQHGASLNVTELRGAAASKPAILNHLSSGKFDIVHYAGHAFFDPRRPERSGIVCHDRVVLSGVELVGLTSLPALVFFNACESGRVRKSTRTAAIDAKLSTSERVQRGTSFAEAFLRGGVANYVGTYWPVGDAAAEAFAGTFYTELLSGKSLGESVMAGRRDVEKLRSIDWADYIFYGDDGFVLKRAG